MANQTSDLFCSTPLAILLLGIQGESGVYYFPRATLGECPGLLLNVKPLLPIYEQLVDHARSLFVREGQALIQIAIHPETIGVLPYKGDSHASLYVGTTPSLTTTDPTWPTWATLMRSMPANKHRLPYLRALQVLAGLHNESIKAVVDEDIGQFFEGE